MRFKLMGSLIAVWLMYSISSTAHAEPFITIHTNYYPISGNNSALIHQSLSQLGPIGKDGKRYHAQTSWELSWNYQWVTSRKNCGLTRIEVHAEVSYLMPKISDDAQLSERMKQQWDIYFAALFSHEQQHKDFAVAAAKELDQKLSALTILPCAELDQRISDLSDQVLGKYQKLELEFDLRTEHGIKQGVVLP